MLEGREWFDVFSLNCYQFAPDREQIAKIAEKLNRPVMIGEYHFGSAEGACRLTVSAVATQRERGDAYRYYVEQAAAIPELIGVHYFQWNDQPALGRFDGENYQIGMVDVCNRPYANFAVAARTAHERMYEVRTGAVQAFDRQPREIPKTGFKMRFGQASSSISKCAEHLKPGLPGFKYAGRRREVHPRSEIHAWTERLPRPAISKSSNGPLASAKASVKTLDRIREESKQQEIYIYTQEFKIYSSFQSVE